MKKETKIKVLIVDNEESFARTLANRLRERQMEAECVFSDEAAITAVSKHPPKVVVLAMTVPGNGGVEILRRMTSTSPEIKVILLAGRSTFMNTGLLCMRYGAADYFLKPLELSQLVEAIIAAAGELPDGSDSSTCLSQ